MDYEAYSNSIFNIILAVAQQVPESVISLKFEHLHKNPKEPLYIYSIDANSNIIRLLPYTQIQNSYNTWLALGGGDSAFLTVLANFITHLCGNAAEDYFNIILSMMGVSTDVQRDE